MSTTPLPKQPTGLLVAYYEASLIHSHDDTGQTFIGATYFLFLKMQLNRRQATAKAMPAVARMEKMTVRERCTDTISFLGTPSYGITPPGSKSECYQINFHVHGRQS